LATQNIIDTCEMIDLEPSGLNNFEQAKCYSKYFVSANIDQVLSRYNPIEKKIVMPRRQKNC
jgi:hypothetical protein